LCTHHLSIPPAPDCLPSLCVYTQARESEKDWDYKCNEIHDLYNLIDQYSIEQIEIDKAAYATLDSSYNQLKGVMEEAESARDENIAKFSIDLEQGACFIRTTPVNVYFLSMEQGVCRQVVMFGHTGGSKCNNGVDEAYFTLGAIDSIFVRVQD
jgi:hypothetical protein